MVMEKEIFFSPLILNLVAQIEKLTGNLSLFFQSDQSYDLEQPHGIPEFHSFHKILTINGMVLSEKFV